MSFYASCNTFKSAIGKFFFLIFHRSKVILDERSYDRISKLLEIIPSNVEFEIE